MAIVKCIGIDPSTTGSCFFELKVDSSTLKVQGYDYYLFNTTKKLSDMSPQVIYINPKNPTYIKIDDTVSDFEGRYLQSNIQSIYTVERFVPSSKMVKNEDWKGIYHVLEHYLRRYNKPFCKIYPVSLKKYATNSGRAEKTEMGLKFKEEGLVDVDLSYISDTKSDKNDPKANVWDAYFLAEISYYTYVARQLGVEALSRFNISKNKIDLIVNIINKPEDY